MKNKIFILLYSFLVLIAFSSCDPDLVFNKISVDPEYNCSVSNLNAVTMRKGISVTWIDPNDRELSGVKIYWSEYDGSRAASSKLENNSIVVKKSTADNRANSAYLEAANKFESGKTYKIQVCPVNEDLLEGKISEAIVKYEPLESGEDSYSTGINAACYRVYIYRQKTTGGNAIANYDYYTFYSNSFAAGTSEKTIVDYYKNYSAVTGFTYSSFIQIGSYVYLFYNRNSITVNFYLDKEKTELYKTFTGLYGTTYSSVPNPTKEGYAFNFWSKDGVNNSGYNTTFSVNTDYIAVWGSLYQDCDVTISMPTGDLKVTKNEYSSYAYFYADSGYDNYRWYIDGVLNYNTTSYNWYCNYSNLTEGVSDITVLARKGEVCYSACFSITVDRSPDAVTSLTAIRGEKKITLSWVNPNVSDLEKVQIVYGSETLEVDAASAVYMTKVIDGLEDGTQYSFYVYAVDAGGKKSGSRSVTTSTLYPRQDSAVVPATPAATIGTAAKANLLSDLPDVIYLAQSTRSYINLRCEVDDSSLYFFQWYKSTDGINFTELSGYNSYSSDFDISDGITYFYLEITHKDTVSYSNICRVEKNTLNTDKIGYIYYSDDTYSYEYNKDKTPIGIVCNVDKNGNPANIVSLDQVANKIWCKTNYDTVMETSNIDGSLNWAIIKAADPTGTADAATIYSAFDWCNKKTTGAKSWYIPAYYEGLQLQYNYQVINKAIERILDLTIMAVKLDSYYWTSSQYKTNLNNAYWYKEEAWLIYTNSSSLSTAYKSNKYYVRAMSKL